MQQMKCVHLSSYLYSIFISAIFSTFFQTYVEHFQRPDVREMFRAFKVTLSVTSTEADPKNPTRPIIHFAGEVKRSGEPVKVMTGTVKLTVDKQVHWHIVRGLFAGRWNTIVSLF